MTASPASRSWHATCISAAMLLNDNITSFVNDFERLDERLRARHAHASEIGAGLEGRRPRTRLSDATRSATSIVRSHEVRESAGASGRMD
jgi:hypothetical protein